MGIFRQDSLIWETSNLLPYYDRSAGDCDDNSFVLVRKHYPDGNLLPFVVNELLPKIRADNDTSQEAVAIYSWCTFLDQISIPLRFLNLGHVALEDIFMEEGDESYDYVLGRIENQFIEKDQRTQIAALVWEAWRYYAILSNEHEILMDEDDAGIIHGAFTNTFASSSRIFWYKTVSSMNAEEVRSVATGVLSRTINFMASAQFNLVRVIRCIEYRIAAFTRRYALPCDDVGQQINWDVFVTELGDICGDWIDTGDG